MNRAERAQTVAAVSQMAAELADAQVDLATLRADIANLIAAWNGCYGRDRDGDAYMQPMAAHIEKLRDR